MGEYEISEFQCISLFFFDPELCFCYVATENLIIRRLHEIKAQLAVHTEILMSLANRSALNRERPPFLLPLKNVLQMNDLEDKLQQTSFLDSLV